MQAHADILYVRTMIMLRHGYEHRNTWLFWYDGCLTSHRAWEKVSVSLSIYLSLFLSSLHINFHLSILFAPQDLSNYWRGKSDVEFVNFLSRCVCYVSGDKRMPPSHSPDFWFLHSCIPSCWIDDIWHRFHVLELSPFDACTNTGPETTVSKCFDAISQQSVKQKTFVAFYTARKNSVNTKGRRDQSTGAEFLCWRPSIHLCVYKLATGTREALMGTMVPCGLLLVKGMILEVHGFW